jgi:hypothetical protein
LGILVLARIGVSGSKMQFWWVKNRSQASLFKML